MKFAELLAFCPKPASFLGPRKCAKVGAPIRGAACVLRGGPCRALDGHDVAVPSFHSTPASRQKSLGNHSFGKKKSVRWPAPVDKNVRIWYNTRISRDYLKGWIMRELRIGVVGGISAALAEAVAETTRPTNRPNHIIDISFERARL